MPDRLEALPKDTATLEWEAMAQALEATVQRSDPYRALTPPLPRQAVVMLLRLLEAQQVDAATRLGHALTEWLDQQHGATSLEAGPSVPWSCIRELQSFGGPLPTWCMAAIAEYDAAILGTGPEVAAWSWLRRLLPFRAHLPPAMMAAIAHGLLEGDLAKARPLLAAQYRVARGSTLAALGVLGGVAPEIEVMVDPFRYDAVSTAEAAKIVRNEREGGGIELLWLALTVLLVFLIGSGLLRVLLD